ncbi:MAG: acyltransferase, partial [Planctomycetota bacterium]
RILSGGRQHEVSDPSQNITETEQTFERVHVGTNTWIGEGAIIMADIGSRCVVAAGSVVFRPVPDGKMVMGNPARAIPRPDAPAARPVQRDAAEAETHQRGAPVGAERGRTT